MANKFREIDCCKCTLYSKETSPRSCVPEAYYKCTVPVRIRIENRLATRIVSKQCAWGLDKMENG